VDGPGLDCKDLLAMNIIKGAAMTDHSEADSRDSLVDARAIFVLILLVVACAVFWVSQQ
jgi:hypothetical protein